MTTKKAPGKTTVWFSGMTPKASRRDRVVVAEIARLKAAGNERGAWQLEQKLVMAEAVRVATIEGERRARLDHERAKRAPSERLGAGELVDLLMRERGR